MFPQFVHILFPKATSTPQFQLQEQCLRPVVAVSVAVSRARGTPLLDSECFTVSSPDTSWHVFLLIHRVHQTEGAEVMNSSEFERLGVTCTLCSTSKG